MQYSELYPEEKLLHWVFGEHPVHHWLTPDQRQAINQMLDDYAEAEVIDRFGSIAGKRRAVHIVRLRLGIIPRTLEELISSDRSGARSLEETAKYYNVTRERIRQIENKLLRRLRHRSFSQKLKPFIKGW